MFSDLEKRISVKDLNVRDLLKLAESCEFKPLTFFSEEHVIEMVKHLEQNL